jgi:redox-sensitive bicupin YhaK (pirin superfamily)
MSAGSGISHSEMNANTDRQVKFLQIWVLPKKEGVEPRYQQITLDEAKLNNQLHQILSPNPEDEGVWIHQDAWFHLGRLDGRKSLTYDLHKSGNGVYAFVIEGEISVNGQKLEKRDGFGLWDLESLNISSNGEAEILLMEIPMNQ